MKMRDLLKDGVVILEISGKITGYDATTLLRGKIHEYIDLNKRNFILDLGKVPWIASHGISMLLGARAAVLSADGRMVLANLTKKSLSILSIMMLASKFEIYDSREEALQAFTK